MMNCMPWAYWLNDGKPKPATREVLAVLNFIAENDPNHPGANHYHIHVVEEVHPDFGTKSADQLAALELNYGHLVHMPSHIYIKTARYNDASIANQKAIAVDEEYRKLCKNLDIYPTIYVPHNVHFLSFSSSMEGRSELAIKQARELVEKSPEKMLTRFRSLEQYFPMPYFALVRFNKWDEILKEPKPKSSLLYTTLIWHYARGMAYVNNGKIHKAENELRNIQQIQAYDSFRNLHNSGWPVNDISEMARLVLISEIEGQRGQHDEKVKHLKKAVTIQEQISFVETPHFYYPIRQSLGYALLEQKKPNEAQLIFNEDLEQWPNNGWSLFGLYKSLKEQKKDTKAKEVKDRYELAWKNADFDL